MADGKKQGGNPQTVQKSKKERFAEVGTTRINKAVHAIELCENLANPNAYEYTDAQVKTLTDALDKAVSGVKAAFANPNRAKAKSGITL